MANGSDRKIGAVSLLGINNVHPADLRLAAGASSPDPLERLNEEVERRADVFGIYDDDAAAIRLGVGQTLGINDERAVARRCMRLQGLARVLHTDTAEPAAVVAQSASTLSEDGDLIPRSGT